MCIVPVSEGKRERVIVVVVIVAMVVSFVVAISIKSDKLIPINPIENPKILFPYASQLSPPKIRGE